MGPELSPQGEEHGHPDPPRPKRECPTPSKGLPPPGGVSPRKQEVSLPNWGLAPSHSLILLGAFRGLYDCETSEGWE